MEFIFGKVKENGGLGARPIVRALQNEIENIICDLYLENEYSQNYVFNVTVIDNKLNIE